MNPPELAPVPENQAASAWAFWYAVLAWALLMMLRAMLASLAASVPL